MNLMSCSAKITRDDKMRIINRDLCEGLNFFLLFRILFALLLGVTSIRACNAQGNSWEGFYFGANGGTGWGKAHWLFPKLNYYTVEEGQSFSTHPDGELIGLQVGLNHQICSWVMGLEAAFEWTALTHNEVGAVTPLYPGDLFETKFNKILQIAAKAGYTYQDWLVHVRAGYTNSKITIGALSANPGPGVSATQHHRKGGFLLGFGLDYMIFPKVSLGLQYDFNHFSDKEFNSTTTGNVVGLPFNVNLQSIYFNTITARLNFFIP